MNGDFTRKHGGFTRDGDLGKNAGFELQKSRLYQITKTKPLGDAMLLCYF
jgi:hypothetical protein